MNQKKLNFLTLILIILYFLIVLIKFAISEPLNKRKLEIQLSNKVKLSELFDYSRIIKN